MTPEQVRAARGWLNWTQAELAERAQVGLSTVKDYEAGRRNPIQNNLLAIIAALESAGISFGSRAVYGPLATTGPEKVSHTSSRTSRGPPIFREVFGCTRGYLPLRRNRKPRSLRRSREIHRRERVPRAASGGADDQHSRCRQCPHEAFVGLVARYTALVPQPA
jgi:transcriptional regulator with XRE-family HTH domain